MFREDTPLVFWGKNTFRSSFLSTRHELSHHQTKWCEKPFEHSGQVMYGEEETVFVLLWFSCMCMSG